MINDKYSFMIHFYDIYVISDSFCSLVLILLHETICFHQVMHQLYEIVFHSSARIANVSRIQRVQQMQAGLSNIRGIFILSFQHIYLLSTKSWALSKILCTCLSVRTKFQMFSSKRNYNSNCLREKVQNLINLGQNRCKIYRSTTNWFIHPCL